jgi:hypothetical protein
MVCEKCNRNFYGFGRFRVPNPFPAKYSILRETVIFRRRCNRPSALRETLQQFRTVHGSKNVSMIDGLESGVTARKEVPYLSKAPHLSKQMSLNKTKLKCFVGKTNTELLNCIGFAFNYVIIFAINET